MTAVRASLAGLLLAREALIEGFENRIVDTGGWRRHIEDSSDGGSAAADVALSALLAAVVFERSDAGQSRGFGVAQRLRP
jgi:ribosomal protein L18